MTEPRNNVHAVKLFIVFYSPCFPRQSMPRPSTVGYFVGLLLGIVRTGSYADKAAVAQALVQLHKTEGLLDLDNIYRTVYDVLRGCDAPPSCSVPDEKVFLESALQLLHYLGVHDLKFFTEALVQLLEGDKQLR